MNDLLIKAWERLQQLPDQQQSAIATLILEELEDEAIWDASFASSIDVLERLTAEAEEEDRLGLTQELRPEQI